MIIYTKYLLVAVLSFFLIGITEPAQTLSARSKTATAWTASWSYDDKYVAVGNDAGVLAIYETKDWKKIRTFQYEATTITRVEWNPKFPILAVAGGSYAGTKSIIQLYDAERDKMLSTSPDNMQGRGVTWKPDGEQVAYVGSKGRINIFSKTGELLKTLSFTHDKSIMDIDWHPKKNQLLIVEEDIFLYDMDDDRLLGTYDDGSKNKGILCCQWHPDGNSFVTGDYGHEDQGGEPTYLKYFNYDGSLIRRIKESKQEFRNVRWTGDGKYLAASADVLLVFDEKGNTVNKIKFDDNNLWGVEWDHKGERIITSDQVGNVRVTDIKGNIIKSFVL